MHTGLDNVVIANIKLVHLLYTLKHLTDARKIYEANKFKHVPYIAGIIFCLLIGESGGIFPRIIVGQHSTFLNDDYKIWTLIVAWNFMYFLPTNLKKKVCDVLTATPYNFILIIPNEFRRGHALCASVRAYRQFANETKYFHEILTPSILGGMSQVMGGFIFPILERNLLNNHSQPSDKEALIDHLTVGHKVTFFCAFFYNLCIVESKTILQFEIDIAQWMVVGAYMVLPIFMYLKRRGAFEAFKSKT
ncbi:hypothetical protein AKO1_007288 [Acrasis kona]|uniref:Uncharacterized protein n=1 Tax=Acrasis kona TaxID=1008807 RepID=A0AAW2YSC1_9EUKA